MSIPNIFPGDLGEPPPEDFPEDPKELPPEYDDDEEVDYALDVEDQSNLILDDIGLSNYTNVELIIKQQQMTPQKGKAYLNKIIKNADFKKKQLNGFKANVTKQFKSGKISEAEGQIQNKRIDNARVTLTEYIKHYTEKKKLKVPGSKAE